MDVLDLSFALVDVETELIQAELLLEKVADVMLKDVATESLLDGIRPREVPRHDGNSVVECSRIK